MTVPIVPDWDLLFVSPKGLSDDIALRKLRVTFDRLIVDEIRRTLKARIGVASMILLCCAIDFLGSLHAGAEAREDTFKAFARRFLPRYDAGRLYSVRRHLVHNYVIPRSGYVFAVGRERATEHLVQGKRQRLILEVLLDDVEQAGHELFAVADTDQQLRANILCRLRVPGLI